MHCAARLTAGDGAASAANGGHRCVERDQYTAQGFETLSAGLTGAVNGKQQVPDADQGRGVEAFLAKNQLWTHRRGLANAFWVDS